MENHKLDSIISEVFVINIKHRTDRWKTVNQSFKGLKLKRWNAIYGKHLTNQQIKEMTIPFCYFFCGYGMIGCWLSHYLLWEHIVKNKLDRVLVLEDDAYPVKDFENKLIQGLSCIPPNYDLIFLGCGGSCLLPSILFGSCSNETICQFDSFKIIKPGHPLGTHAYIISYQGAKKLFNVLKDQKITGHIDKFLSRHIYSQENFKIYAFSPTIINAYSDANLSDNTSKDHPLLSLLLKKIQNPYIVDSYNTQLVCLRKISWNLTPFSLIFMILSFFLGLMLSVQSLKIYIGFIIFYYIIEIIVSHMQINMIYELVLVIFATFIGYNLKKMIVNNLI
jgi:glycosyl transferase, family 25